MKRAIKFVFIFFGYQLLAVLPVGLILGINSITNPSATSDIESIGLSLAFLAANILIIWHFIHFRNVRVDKKSLSPISYRVVLETLIMGMASIILLGWLSEVINLPDYMSDAFDELDNVYGMISICLLGPIAEELVFRGAIEGHLLRKWKNPKMAIFVSALIFGLFHANPAQIPFAFLIGLLLGWIYYRSGSLLLVMLVHVLNNSLSVLIASIYSENATLTQLVGESSVYIVLAGAFICFMLSFWRLRQMLPKPIRQTETEQE